MGSEILLELRHTHALPRNVLVPDISPYFYGRSSRDPVSVRFEYSAK